MNKISALNNPFGVDVVKQINQIKELRDRKDFGLIGFENFYTAETSTLDIWWNNHKRLSEVIYIHKNHVLLL